MEATFVSKETSVISKDIFYGLDWVEEWQGESVQLAFSR